MLFKDILPEYRPENSVEIVFESISSKIFVEIGSTVFLNMTSLIENDNKQKRYEKIEFLGEGQVSLVH